ncbi:MAG: Uncharacterised protein [Methanobacteriota archaeon]|nr:MAG: Uncharacterised protein [Euryarchaeota archaeon]
MAIKKPQDIPINILSSPNENSRLSAPAEANTLLNAKDISQAKKIPKIPPKIEAIEEVITPSIKAMERISERFNPKARIVASSTLLCSANMITIVNTSKIPAPMVNVPNTRNIAESTPAPSSALCEASSFAALILKSMVLVPATSSNHANIAVSLPPLMISILRSPSEAEANFSPSERLTKPMIIVSSSSNPGTFIEDIEPLMVKISGVSSP